METIQLSQHVINWAIKQAGLSLEAITANMNQAKKERYASGNLTISDAKSLAKTTRIPFGYLFLKDPPKIVRPLIPDLRQTVDRIPLSDNFFDLLKDIIKKQEWYLEYLKDLGAHELPFVGRFKDDKQAPAVIAEHMRKTIKLTIADRNQCRNRDDYYNVLSKAFETSGILVFKSGIVGGNNKKILSVNEFRGFALADKLAPVIFINGKDSEAGRIFTLAHEAAHIWLGISGVSDSKDSDNRTEALCNKVAAEFLVPLVEFNQLWKRGPIQESLDRLSNYFKVSRLVIARRALDLRLIPKSCYNEEQLKIEKTIKKQSSGGDYYRNIPVANSRRFTKTLLREAMSGGMLLREAGGLLNMKPDNIVVLHEKMQKGSRL